MFHIPIKFDYIYLVLKVNQVRVVSFAFMYKTIIYRENFNFLLFYHEIVDLFWSLLAVVPFHVELS